MKMFLEFLTMGHYTNGMALIIQEVKDNKLKEFFNKLKIGQKFYFPSYEAWICRVQKKYKDKDVDGDIALFIEIRILHNDLKNVDYVKNTNICLTP